MQSTLATLDSALLIAGSLAAQTPTPETPDPEKVKARDERLEVAFDEGEVEDRVAALEDSTGLADAAVIEWQARGLADKEPTIRDAGLQALRRTFHPQALEALTKFYKRKKKQLREDEELCARFVQAIAQHGNAESLPLLSENPFGTLSGPIVKAHILGLGNIRTKESAEALVDLMRAAGRNRIQNYMGDFRMSLMRLTGVDQGNSQDAWTRWWNDHHKDLEIAAEPPLLPREWQRRWDAYWGNERRYDRPPERGGRGGE